MTEQTPPPVAPETPEAAPTKFTGYAVYDKELTRYVTGVYPTKSAAEDAVTKVKGRKYETRQV